MKEYIQAFMVACVVVSSTYGYISLYEDYVEEPKTKEGEMHYFKPEIERDSVTYDQHPNKKCWHLTNENR